MNITELQVENFRCFHKATIPLQEELTVIVGINGAGKTTILEALALSLGTFFTAFDQAKSPNIRKTDAFCKYYPMGSDIDVQPQFPVHLTATGSHLGEDIQWTRSLQSSTGKTTLGKAMAELSKLTQQQMMSGDSALKLPLIAYYSTGRLWDYHGAKRRDHGRKNNRANGYLGCLDGTANVKYMMQWFEKKAVTEALESSPSSDFIAVRSAMEQCFSLITASESPSIRYNYDTKELDILYGTGENRRLTPITQLSDGYKSTISLIADIAYRIATLNPALGTEVLRETSGIILIDELDLHLHPAWQQRILRDLREIFPKIQFIVTTHAPSIINSVKRENLLLLHQYQIQELTTEAYGKDVKSVLQEIMGVTERPPEVAVLFQNFYLFLQEGDFASAEETLDQLDILRDYHDPEVASCRVKLKLERIRGGKT